MPRMTSFAAQQYLREHGRCPKGFTASSSGRCEENSPWQNGSKPAFGRVPFRGKGSRRGKRRHAGLIEMVRASAEKMRTATIRKCAPSDKDERPEKDQVWCLYTSDGKKLLGRHPSKEAAENQERAVQVHKHGQSADEGRHAPWDTPGASVQADLLSKPEAAAVNVQFKEALDRAGNLCKKILFSLVKYGQANPEPNWSHLSDTTHINDQLNEVAEYLAQKLSSGTVSSKDPVTVG